jgi:hypothetical protein
LSFRRDTGKTPHGDKDHFPGDIHHILLHSAVPR